MIEQIKTNLRDIGVEEKFITQLVDQKEKINEGYSFDHYDAFRGFKPNNKEAVFDRATNQLITKEHSHFNIINIVIALAQAINLDWGDLTCIIIKDISKNINWNNFPKYWTNILNFAKIEMPLKIDTPD